MPIRLREMSSLPGWKAGRKRERTPPEIGRDG